MICNLLLSIVCTVSLMGMQVSMPDKLAITGLTRDVQTIVAGYLSNEWGFYQNNACHKGKIKYICFAPNNSAIITVSHTDHVKIWSMNLQQRAELELFGDERITALTVSPDSQLLALGSKKGDIILVRLSDFEMLDYSCDTLRSRIFNLYFTSASTILATSHKGLIFYDLSTFERIQDPKKPYCAESLSACGKYGAWRSSYDGTERSSITVFDLERAAAQPNKIYDNYIIHQFPGQLDIPEKQALGFRSFFSEHYFISPSRHELRLLSLPSGILRKLQGHTGTDPYRAVAISPGEKYLVHEGSQGIIIWDLASVSWVGSLTVHCQPVTELAFSLDGQYLAVGHQDGTVILLQNRAQALVGNLKNIAI